MNRTLLAMVLLLLPHASHAAEPRSHAEQIVPAIEQAIGILHTKYSQDICLNDNFCEVFFDTIQVQFVGAGVVDVLVSDEVSVERYLTICAAVLGVLSGDSIQNSIAITEQAFQKASSSGKFSEWIGATQFRVVADFRGLLGCSFFKR